MKKSLFLLAFLAFLLLLSPKKTLASNPIRITGFDYPRNQQPFYNPFKSEDWGEDYVSEIVSEINNPNNFGGSGSIVNCGVYWLPFVNTIFPNSLVNSGQKTADVFIAGSITSELSSTEAMELKNFLQAGGVVFISGNSPGTIGADYHSFFELLGVNDRFSSEYDESEEIGISHTPISTPITNGAFGQVGRLGHLPFRIFNHSSLIPVAKAFEEGGFFTVLSFQTSSTGLSENFILFEKGFGGGYLSVAGEPIYTSDYNYENVRYFLNLVGYACERNSGGGGVGGSITLNVSLFKQTDPQWEEMEYDSANSQRLWCGRTIGQCGCATTSIAMILNYYGITKAPDGGETNPKNLNDYFKQDPKRTVCGWDNSDKPIYGWSTKGYSCGSVRWTAAEQYSVEANKIFGTQKIKYNGSRNYNFTVVTREIQDQNPVILAVPGHFITAKGASGNTLLINDPAYNRVTLNDPAYGNTAQGIRSYKRTSSDFSKIEVSIVAPGHVLVTDKNGRKTGYDRESSSVITDIPNSEYYFDEFSTDPTGENPQPPDRAGINWATINTPELGSYKIEVVGPNSTTSGYTIYATDKNANLEFSSFETTISEIGSSPLYEFTYSPEPDSNIILLNVSIDILPLVKKNLILGRLRYLIPVGIFSTEIFNTQNVDRSSVKFGKTGDEDSLSFCLPFHLNRDSKEDLVCFFKSWETNFKKGDTKGILRGILDNGSKIIGEDSVVVW